MSSSTPSRPTSPTFLRQIDSILVGLQKRQDLERVGAAAEKLVKDLHALSKYLETLSGKDLDEVEQLRVIQRREQLLKAKRDSILRITEELNQLE